MTFSTLLRRIRLPVPFLFALLAAVSAICADAGTHWESPPASAQAEAARQSPFIVIGILGGVVKHDDPVRSEVKLAEHLRADYPDGVDVETFENRHRKKALQAILTRLGSTPEGNISDDQKHAARIVLYGHSLGGSAVVQLARELEKRGIPVLLTIQVDSVQRIGEHDGVIPPNVARAVNFYQPNGLIHGRSRIRAEAPSKTQILGNYRFDYKGHPVNCPDYPWFERTFVKTHTEIACDPNVWLQVEALIRQQIGPGIAR